MYVVACVDANAGETPHEVTVKKVPVDAFWSVTVYNADGYLETNDLGVNSYNNFSADPSDAGSYTLHFGGCEDGRTNCTPTHPAGTTRSACTSHVQRSSTGNGAFRRRM